MAGTAQQCMVIVKDFDNKTGGEREIVIGHFNLDGRDIVQVFVAVGKTSVGRVNDIQV